MKRHFAATAMCLLASISLAPRAHAKAPPQPNRCPFFVVNPDQLLIGGALPIPGNTTWVYQVQGVSSPGATATGQFTARISGANRLLDVNDSSSIVTSRLQAYTGRWSVNADCSGGTLTLNSNVGAALQYDFWFSNNGFTEMLLVSTDIGKAFLGFARRVIP